MALLVHTAVTMFLPRERLAQPPTALKTMKKCYEVCRRESRARWKKKVLLRILRQALYCRDGFVGRVPSQHLTP